MSERLKQAAQAVLDRWNSPQWDWHKHGPTGNLMEALRVEIDAIQSEKSEHRVNPNTADSGKERQ